MKKVLHILNSLLPSGAETMLKTAAPYWDSEFQHHILATAKELGDFAIELENVGYNIHHIYSDNIFKQLYKMQKFIKKEKFQIVHIHCESKAVKFEMVAKMAGAKRIIRTVHNVFLFDGVLRFRRIITRHIGCFIGVQHVAISQSVLENEKRRFFVKCILVNNWYDEKKFVYVDAETKALARQLLGIDEKKICLVTVGNCSKIKNHMAILKALVVLKNDNIIYFHIGKGKEEEEEEAYVKEYNLNNVWFEGFKDPLIYLQASDYFIMPSVYEGVGISALEAMATGMKCLLTDVYGLKDFRKYDFEMVDFCDLNDESIVNAIKKFIKSERKENSIMQSKKVNKNYGIMQGVVGYQKIYKS